MSTQPARGLSRSCCCPCSSVSASPSTWVTPCQPAKTSSPIPSWPHGCNRPRLQFCCALVALRAGCWPSSGRCAVRYNAPSTTTMRRLEARWANQEAMNTVSVSISLPRDLLGALDVPNGFVSKDACGSSLRLSWCVKGASPPGRALKCWASPNGPSSNSWPRTASTTSPKRLRSWPIRFGSPALAPRGAGMIVVANAGPLIALAQIGHLHILPRCMARSYPPSVRKESIIHIYATSPMPQKTNA